MNTQPDRAVEPDDKPRPLVDTCTICQQLFTRPANRTDSRCNHCSGRFENDFARIFGQGRGL